MAVTTTYPFDTAANYSFDSSKIEVSGGCARLSDQRPNDGLIYANYTLNQNAAWSRGSAAGTLFGAATVSAGKLNLTTANNNYCSYSGVTNMPSGNIGCVRFTFNPNYSGSTGGINRYLFASSTAENDISNLIRVMHINTVLRLDIYDNAGLVIHTSQTGNAFSPTAGTDYEMEFNWNTTTGQHRFFINGILLNGVKTGTGTIGARGIIRVGKDYTNSVNAGANGTIDNLIIFDEVQHTANYTPGEAIPQTRYSTAGDIITTQNILNSDGLATFADSIIEPGSDSVGYTVNVNGVRKYWDGADWVNADGSFAQTNDAATINSNALSLPVNNTSISFSSHLNSAAGDTTPEVCDITASYDFNNPSIADEIETVNVFGYMFNPDGTPDAGATVEIRPLYNSRYLSENTVVPKDVVTLTTDIDGGWNTELIKSASIQGTIYEFTFISTANAVRYTLRRFVSGNVQIAFEDLKG